MTPPLRASTRARAARAFTLLEVMIVITVIITLMSLVLGVGSALLRNAEKSQVESAMQIIESGLNEFEAQMGRQMTFNGAYDAAGTLEVFPIGAVDAVFDVRNPGTAPANNTGDRIWVNRARGLGDHGRHVTLPRQDVLDHARALRVAEIQLRPSRCVRRVAIGAAIACEGRDMLRAGDQRRGWTGPEQRLS